MKTNKPINLEEIRNAWKSILIAIGEDPKREGLRDTPERIAKMYKEIFSGYSMENRPKLTFFSNGSNGMHYGGMICDKGYFFSQCEHHGVPFFGEYFFAYVPDKRIIGLSKIARVVDFYSSKLQIQERLTKEIFECINSSLKPKGAILVLKARHLCKEMRGVRKTGGFMISSESGGVFKKNKNGIREDFMTYISSKHEN